MIARNEYKVIPMKDGRYQVQDKDRKNRGTFATRDEANAQLASLTTNRAQVHRAAKDLAMVAVTA